MNHTVKLAHGRGEQQLPLYQCHKRVQAVEVQQMEYDDVANEFVIHPKQVAGAVLQPFIVPKAWVVKHNIKPGWWVVLYANGHMSASPPKEFETGYTRVEGMQRRREDLERELDKIEAAMDAADRAQRAGETQ